MYVKVGPRVWYPPRETMTAERNHENGNLVEVMSLTSKRVRKSKKERVSRDKNESLGKSKSKRVSYCMPTSRSRIRCFVLTQHNEPYTSIRVKHVSLGAPIITTDIGCDVESRRADPTFVRALCSL